MSAIPVPEGLKVITPFLQRANQFADKEPIVSYYSNYYAAKLAIQKANKDNRAFIDNLLSTLEKQRKEIGDNEAISNDLVGYAHIENFALKIFAKADDEDRRGQATQKTAKSYIAAANFLELLKVFGEIDSDTEEKIKYSKWRTIEIVKAIREGRTPAPPQGASKTTPDLGNPAVSPNNLGGIGSVDTLATSTHGDPAAVVSGTETGATSGFVTPANGTGGPGGITSSTTSHPTIANFPSPPLSNAVPPAQQPQSFSQPPNPSQHTQFQDNGFQQQQQQSPILPSLAPAPPALPTSTPPPMAPSSFGSSSSGQPPMHPHQQPLPHQQPPPMSVQPPSMQPQFQNHPQPPMHQQQQQHHQQSPFVHSSPLPPSTSQPHQIPPQQPPSAPPQMPQYHAVPGQPSYQQQPSPAFSPAPPVPMVLDPAVSAQVQKHCKWTISALTYDDVPTAIENLEKALALLRVSVLYKIDA
ncbi:hypothetical protein BGW41_000112 [Actinomortierella wolfii]|nr:hypothetical protein BGW41_000112 [Actinomortierella wolfii]